VWTTVEAQPVVSEIVVHVPRRGTQPAREATLALRYCRLTLSPPRHRKREGLPAVELWAVQVREVQPPAHVEPIEWLLLTTVAVEHVEEAIERVQWYQQFPEACKNQHSSGIPTCLFVNLRAKM
jgi:hypothetical protein